jgi:RNA polymerase primary sigma factor
LWTKWKQDRDEDTLQALFNSHRPLIRKLTQELQGNLPPSSVEAKIKREYMNALETYDPTKGAQLNTHIVGRSRKVLRDIYKLQNVARLPEATTIKVPMYQNLKANLSEQLGRDATHGEIAKEMSTSIGEVQRLEQGLRRDLIAIPGQLQHQRSVDVRMMEVLEHTMYELTPQEQAVMEYTFGVHGKPELSAQDIAMRLGITPARVSQIKGKIAGIVQQHYGGARRV